MSIVKPRGLSRNDAPAEIEGRIRELVRRQTTAVRQPGDISAREELMISHLWCNECRDNQHKREIDLPN